MSICFLVQFPLVWPEDASLSLAGACIRLEVLDSFMINCIALSVEFFVVIYSLRSINLSLTRMYLDTKRSLDTSISVTCFMERREYQIEHLE
jgi:hypothetical protein